MKLYIWKPSHHGRPSFFVMAKSLQKAKTAIKKEIKRLIKESVYEEASEENNYEEKRKYYKADLNLFGTTHYELTIHDENSVVLNDND